jgi:hypothetical protein
MSENVFCIFTAHIKKSNLVQCEIITHELIVRWQHLSPLKRYGVKILVKEILVVQMQQFVHMTGISIWQVTEPDCPGT